MGKLTQNIVSYTILYATVLSVLTAAPAFGFGPFPGGTTVFVDVSNSGFEIGTASFPFNTIGEAIDAASPGAVIGVAPGTYSESGHVIGKPLSIMGTDPAVTTWTATGVSQTTPPYTYADYYLLCWVDSPHVRLSGLTLTGQAVDAPYALILLRDESSIRVDHNIVIGNEIGEATCNPFCDSLMDRGPTIDHNVLRDSRIRFDYGSFLNNLLIDSYIYAGGTMTFPLRIINNTFVTDGGSPVPRAVYHFIGTPINPSFVPPLFMNNIVAGKDTGLEVSWDGSYFKKAEKIPYQVWNNLFDVNDYVLDYYHEEGVYPELSLSTAGSVNALPSNGGNLVGDPQFLNPQAEDFHLTGLSPAIDAANTPAAPPLDLDGNFRPVDGNGDCIKGADIGAYEAQAIPPTLAQAARCFKYLLPQPQRWIIAGCETVDCCPLCPGRNVLEWIVSVQGAPINALVLRFGNLSPEGTAALRWEGAEAEWIGADRLLVLGGNEIRIQGIPFPTAEDLEQGTAVTVTAESVSSKRSLIGSTVNLNLMQLVDGTVIAENSFDYEIRKNKCPGCATQRPAVSFGRAAP
jgi:hypothetical protein